MVTTWIKTPSGVRDIPLGEFIVMMEDGRGGFCEGLQGSNCIIHLINNQFYFDMSPVVAYMPFPEYKELPDGRI